MPRDVVGLPIPGVILDLATTPLGTADYIIVVQNNSLRRALQTAVTFQTKGATSARPTLTAASAGFYYYDTTLARPIWWSGTAWKDAAGASV